jgi:hypothetical protein
MSADPLREQEGNSRWWRLLSIVLVPLIALVGILSQAVQTDVPQGPAAKTFAATPPLPILGQGMVPVQKMMLDGMEQDDLPAEASEEARLGARCVAADDTLAEQLDLLPDQGQGVARLIAGGPAAQVGLCAGDVLLELNGQPVPRQRARFLKLLGAVPGNRPVDVVVLRKRERTMLRGLTLPPVMGMAAPGAGPALPIVARLPVPQRNFHASSERNGVTIDVRGCVHGGETVVRSISIQDGGQTTKYGRVEDVPAEYREQVRGVIERATRDRDKP